MQREQRGFIVVLILSAVLLFGWQAFINWKWPQPQKAKPEPAKAALKLKISPLQYRDALRAGVGAVLPDLPPLGNAVNLAAMVGLAHAPERNVPLQRYVDSVRSKQAKQEAEVRRVLTLGDDSTNLKVELTSLGAGVQSVTLNKFQAADRHGLPQKGKLRLIQGEDQLGQKLQPAFRLYHFKPAVQEATARPWDSLGTLDWTLVDDSVKKTRTDEGNEITTEATFTAEVPGEDVILSKTYSLAPGDYHIGLSVKMQRKPGGTEPVQFRYQLAGGHGLPIEGEWYTSTFRTALVGQVDSNNNLWRNYQDSRFISVEQGGKEVERNPERLIRYAGVAVQYFTSTIVVDDHQADQNFLVRARPTLPWTGYTLPDEHRPQLGDITMRVNSKVVDLKPESVVEHKYVLYHGPMKVALLRELTAGGGNSVSEDLIRWYKDDLRLDTLTDYHYQMEGFAGTMSRFFSAIYWTNVLIACTNLMHWVLNALHHLIPNYGICILLLTIIVRMAMFPISRRQALMSIRMQALAPEMKKVQEKYKDDLQARQQAVMELYRKHGVNPLGSCWIMFLQMPVFMGLYYALQESVHFRLSGFLWMNNLAAPDMLFHWGENIPWISRPEDMGGFFYLGPYFNLLPLIAVALMVVQQKLFTPPPADEQQEMQMKMMKYMMIFMGILFYKVASGLALYFIISSAWGLAERRMLPKAQRAGASAEPAAKSVKPLPTPKQRTKAEKDRKEKNGTIQKVQDWWEEVLRQAKKK